MMIVHPNMVEMVQRITPSGHREIEYVKDNVDDSVFRGYLADALAEHSSNKEAWRRAGLMKEYRERYGNV